MAGYVIRTSVGTANYTGLDFQSHCNYYTDRKNSVQSCTRFRQAVAALPKDEYLGWELSVDLSGALKSYVFSSESANVSEEDFAWMFEANASVHSDSAHLEDTFWEGQRVYAFTCKTEQDASAEKERIRRFRGSCDDDDDLDEMNCFSDLIKMMRQLGGASIRILAMSDGCGHARGGEILISLPVQMTLRMKAALSIAFRDVVLKGECEGQEFSGEMIPFCNISDPMAALQAALMRDENVRKDEEVMESMEAEKAGKIEEAGTSEDWTSSADETEAREIAKTKAVFTRESPIVDLELSVRSFNCLRRAGVSTVGKLMEMSDEELMRIRNLGARGAAEIRGKLADIRLMEEEQELEKIDYKALLDELIGLREVKEQIAKITAYARMQRDRKDRGLPVASMAFNMEFVGNPGTAKTTVARILAGIFHEIGLLSGNEMVEVGRADLIARYEGQTAEKVKGVFMRAKGRVLFIDEAYSLLENCEGAYGDEAIDTIVQEMENHREETIVIFAGYPEEMERFLARNPGLKSRVPFHIFFPDYSVEELEQITELEIRKRGFTLQDQARAKIADLCRSSKALANAGNGRFCRNLAEHAILEYAARVYGDEGNVGEGDFSLQESDFSAGMVPQTEKSVSSIGFLA